VTKQVRLPKGGEVIFTLKEHFDRVKFTLEGVRGECPRAFTVPEDIRDADLDLELSVGEAPRTSPESTHIGAETTRVVPVGDALRGAEPHDIRCDSMGRPYPCDEYGHRIVAGSRRPPGAPPDVWRKMSANEKGTISGPSVPGGAASFGEVAGIAQAGEDQEFGPLRVCEQAVQAWFDGVYDFVPCGAAALSGGTYSERAGHDGPEMPSGGNLSEHRGTDFCFFPSAAVCRPVTKKEMMECPAAHKAIQQKWDRLRARNLGTRSTLVNGRAWPAKPESLVKTFTWE
jgi:hypothetical protein